jgi:D-arabinose 1-dehydrogenase-like Zn-dependent alcohol dehydrogenase
MAVGFARHMGFHTVAIGRGGEKEKLAKDLGAHVYIDTAVDDAAAVLQRWAERGQFSRQLPVLRRWVHLCPVLESAAS